jgi:histidine kinase
LVALVAYLGIHTQEENSIARTLQSGNWFSDTVKRATRYAMLKDQRESVHATIEAMGQQEGVDVVRVFNKRGRVMFSTRRSEIGDLVDMHAEACYVCHIQDQPPTRLPLTQRSRIYASRAQPGQPSHRVLGVINPIHTEPACYTDPCHVHTPDQTVLGVLDVSLSLAKVDQEVAETTRQLTTFTVVIVLVISGILISFTVYFVNRPLDSLLKASRQIASGDYEHAIAPQTDDEIGSLAESFETMRKGIKEKTDLLEETRRQYQDLFEQVPCHITVQDRDFRLVAFNKKFEQDFGGCQGDFCYQAYKGRDDKCPTCSVEKTFGDGQIHSAEETVVGKDGQPIYILNLTAPLRDKHGNITAVMEMATDITPVRILEDELRKSEEKYRLFFNNDPIPVLVFDQETLEVLDANDRATAEYLFPKDELIGRSFLDLTSSAEQVRVKEFLAAKESVLHRVLQRRADGSPFFVNLRASYGEHMGRQAVIATTADLTAIIETEQNLIQAAKMATLGEMSAGVAHELNQPLSIMATAGNFLSKQAVRGDAPEPELLKEVAGEILAQVERAKRIINHLRQFGRKAKVGRAKISLGEPIQGVFQLLWQQLRVHGIAFSCDLPDDLPAIWGDVNRLEQVFINLVLNALDAIEKRRQEGSLQEGTIAIRAWREDGMVRVSVTDNGSGIPQDEQERIFEPFFTTKEVGKGTGLGLSISYGIVRDYGGTIEVSSQPGQGATFLLGFPVAREEAAA